MAGRNGAIDHETIVAATIEVVGRRGYHGATVAEIAAVAGVSLHTVLHRYGTREECFLAAYRAVSAELVATTFEAYDAEAEWIDGLRAGLRALLESAAADPARARVCFVEAPAAGRRAMEARNRTIVRLEALFDAAPMPIGHPQWPLLARSLIGGIDFIIGRRVEAGRAAELPGLTDDLTTLASTPFLGPDGVR
jgi:AcrR family transcriptional regulator